MRKLSCALSGLIVGALPLPAAAQGQQAPAQPASRQQTPPPGPGDDEGSDDIVVSGELRGAVPGDIKPEEQLTSGDIRAYGVNSISDLLAQLAPQTSSARGRGGEMPVVLLNGRRISGFSEIRDLPVEAIERVDILPEEAALKFGYRADQRVVNIVLRQRFRAITSELGASFPTAGGNSGKKVSADLLKIARDSRINVDVQYQSNSAILESERNVVPTLPGGTVDAAPYRTLVGPGSAATFTATYSRNLSSKTSMSINARLEQSQRESLLGLPALNLVVPAGNPFSSSATDTSLTLYPQPTALQRSSNNRTAHLGLTLNGDLKPWRWSVTGNYDRITSETITGTGFDPAPFQARLDAGDPAFNPFAPIAPTLLMMRAADRAHSVSSVGALDALLSGPLVKLPAGSATLSVRGTAGTSQFDSGSLRGGIARSGSVGRGRFDGQASLDIPLTSRREGVLGAIGDLGINGNVEVEHLSDFGTLTTLGYGAHWAPISAAAFHRLGHRRAGRAERAAARRSGGVHPRRARVRFRDRPDGGHHRHHRRQSGAGCGQKARVQAGAQRAAVRQGGFQPQRRLRPQHDPQPDLDLPDRHARAGGGLPRPFHPRCERAAAEHRPAPAQFPARLQLAAPLGLQPVDPGRLVAGGAHPQGAYRL